MEPESSSPETPQATPGPVMDVVAPPPPETQGETDEKTNPPAEDDNQKPSPPAPPAAPKKPVPPAKPSNGVGLAIFATVVIVLGLAALATYAYLKTR